VKQTDDVDLDSPLFGDGVGLDSMDTAELAAILEDELGSDPYSAGMVPQTGREIIEFYTDEPFALPDAAQLARDLAE
jgi:acyl carrier protein